MVTKMANPFILTSGCWLYGIKPQYVQVKNLTEDELATLEGCAYDDGYDCVRVLVDADDTATAALLETEYAHAAGQTAEGQKCFELTLGDCPILPIPMHPAYRYGEMTPWGGSRLRERFGKDTKNDRTGESLEVSCIPGLESRDALGRTLPGLIREFGAKLVGDYADQPFPLLLKLIDAREKLSVQVHPDDPYAREHENKLGKTEAWVILNAEEGASILYGIEDGVSIDQLGRALTAGEDIEPMIHRVPVKAGDVFYMPSGMVHAIGGGIVLYEIQQSSDVTYRLWDFNRTNDKGEKRPLHIQQSLDVIDPALKGQLAHMPEGGHGVTRLLDVPAFKLDCACVNGQLPLDKRPGFVMLTPIDDLTLSWEGASMPVKAGQSVLLAANGPAVTLQGAGRALLSAVC